MADFYEIDFLDVDSKRSGDAIAVRHSIGDNTARCIQVIDAGYQDTGNKLVDHIRSHYENPWYIENVVATHPDRDHAGGLVEVVNEFQVGTVWMFRPWLYAEQLLPNFPRWSSAENLRKRLKEIYPRIAALEEATLSRGFEIREPLQGSNIGPFTVLSPTLEHYLDQVVKSEKTPESISIDEEDRSLAEGIIESIFKAARLLRAVWGDEKFSPNETSAENEMSVVLYGEILGHKILLTADSGRSSLSKAADYAENIGIGLPGLDLFQAPHHGSRRNLSSEILDRWLGTKLGEDVEPFFRAYISASKEDKDHPRNAVVRAIRHRGGSAFSTEGSDKRASKNAPPREGWSTATPLPYPQELED